MATFNSEQMKHLSPEYLAEDASKSPFNLSIAFIVIQTFFFVLFIASRLTMRSSSARDLEIYFVPAAYLCCMGQCIIALGMPHPSIRLQSTGNRLLVVTDCSHSPNQTWRLGTPCRVLAFDRSQNHNQTFEGSMGGVIYISAFCRLPKTGYCYIVSKDIRSPMDSPTHMGDWYCHCP